MNTGIRTHTAVHVLKGAAQHVLGTHLTTGVHVQGADGRLTVQCSRKPTDEEIKQVEEEANQCISENKEVHVHEMDRRAAEQRFGTVMYDAFPVPLHITCLAVVEIQGWNINCCNKEHTRTTGDAGTIKIVKTRSREAKQVLEIPFRVE